MLSWKWIAPVVIALAIVLAGNVSTPRPAEAFIDEIIAAYCNGDAPPGVVPPGQVKGGQSLVRALQATGFIVSIVPTGPNQLTITFDPTVPNSKFMAHGAHDVVEPDPDGPGPEPELVLSPHIVPDPNFPAFEHCKRFNLVIPPPHP